ncbi:MAG: c-type cytochrome [Pseudomonadota bacterium]
MVQHRRPKVVSPLGLLLAVALVAGPTQAFGFERPVAEIRIAQANPDAPAEQPQTDPAAAPQEALPQEGAPQEALPQETAEEAPPPEPEEEKCCKAGDKTPPFKLIAETPVGELSNPYDWRTLAEENQDDPAYLAKQFALPGCNACHGNEGAGNICPSLTQGDWPWGNTDDVLFRLIALGSVEMQRQGFTRYKEGSVKAPMPEMGQVVKTSDQLWRIIAFIRSISPPASNPPEKVIPGQYQAPVTAAPAQ